MMARAALTAASTAGFSSAVPITAAAASLACCAVSARLESAMAQVATLPRDTVRTTPAAAVA